MQNNKPLFFNRFGTIMNTRCSMVVNASFCFTSLLNCNPPQPKMMFPYERKILKRDLRQRTINQTIYCEVFYLISLRCYCDKNQESCLYPHEICSLADGNNICPFVRCHYSFLLKYFVQVYYVAITFKTILYFCSRTKMTKCFLTSPQKISLFFTVVPSEYKLILFVKIT